MKKKILITGSAGFLFNNLIRRAFFTKQPFNVVSLDRVSDAYILHNIYINKDHEFYIADVKDTHTLNVIFNVERPTIVIHGASESDVSDSIVSTNVVGTQNIIDACVKTGVEKLVLISADQIYGELESENDKSWTEESVVNPRNTYAATKAASELLVRAAYVSNGLQYQIVRLSNSYGPWQRPDKLIPKTIGSLLANKPIELYGSGAQIRDWMHVFDVCDAIFKVIEDGETNSIYNISAGQEFSNVDIFQIICKTLGGDYNLLKFVNDRIGHDFRYSMDSSKLKELGWKPTIKFRDGIVQVCQWYLNNKFFLEQGNHDNNK